MTLVANRLLSSFLVCTALLSQGCLQSEEVLSVQGRTMGTTYSIKFFAQDKSLVEKVRSRAEKDLREVNQQMSTYIEESEISKVNRAKAGAPIPISEWFAQTLKYSLDLAKKTDGKFDPTIGPLVNLWGFGPGKKRTSPPSDEEIRRVREYVGYKKVNLSQEKGQWFVTKAHDKVYVDLSASAKGFGVDVLSRSLTEMGFNNHLVEIGGELRASGKKLSQNWRVAIEKPDSEKRAVQKVLPLENHSLATSGSYRNFFTSGDKSYSHALDQKTGEPVAHTLVSVSILEKDCMKADALATALMVMGPEDALQFARANGIAAYLIISENVDGELQPRELQTDPFLKVGGAK